MKTNTSFRYSNFPLPLKESHSTVKGKVTLKTVAKSDFCNHRFAIIDNKSIQDPTNWDPTWFAQYE